MAVTKKYSTLAILGSIALSLFGFGLNKCARDSEEKSKEDINNMIIEPYRFKKKNPFEQQQKEWRETIPTKLNDEDFEL